MTADNDTPKGQPPQPSEGFRGHPTADLQSRLDRDRNLPAAARGGTTDDDAQRAMRKRVGWSFILIALAVAGHFIYQQYQPDELETVLERRQRTLLDLRSWVNTQTAPDSPIRATFRDAVAAAVSAPGDTPAEIARGEDPHLYALGVQLTSRNADAAERLLNILVVTSPHSKAVYARLIDLHKRAGNADEAIYYMVRLERLLARVNIDRPDNPPEPHVVPDWIPGIAYSTAINPNDPVSQLEVAPDFTPSPLAIGKEDDTYVELVRAWMEISLGRLWRGEAILDTVNRLGKVNTPYLRGAHSLLVASAHNIQGLSSRARVFTIQSGEFAPTLGCDGFLAVERVRALLKLWDTGGGELAQSTVNTWIQNCTGSSQTSLGSPYAFLAKAMLSIRDGNVDDATQSLNEVPAVHTDIPDWELMVPLPLALLRLEADMTLHSLAYNKQPAGETVAFARQLANRLKSPYAAHKLLLAVTDTLPGEFAQLQLMDGLLGDRTASRGVRARALVRRASAVYELNRLEEAVSLARQALDRLGTSGDHPEVAMAYHVIGQVAWAQGRVHEAIPALETAANRYNAINRPIGFLYESICKAQAEFVRGNRNGAEEHLEVARRIVSRLALRDSRLNWDVENAFDL